jgi:hypothetical protein
MQSRAVYPPQRYKNFYWITQARLIGSMAMIVLTQLITNKEFVNLQKNVDELAIEKFMTNLFEALESKNPELSECALILLYEVT